MNLLKVLFKILSLFLLAVIFSALVGTLALSFWLVTGLSKIRTEQSADPNLKALTQIGQKYIVEIHQFESVMLDIGKHQTPPLCSVVCNDSTWEAQRFLEQRGFYLKSFYGQHKADSLLDPQFRLKLLELDLISKVFPTSIRLWVNDLMEHPQIELTSHRFRFAMQLELLILKELPGIRNLFKNLKQDSLRLDTLRGLIHSCKMGIPRKKVMQECHAEFAK